MLEHNTDEYVSFLRFLAMCKLYHCCCCCAKTISDMLHQQESFGAQKFPRTEVSAHNECSMDEGPNKLQIKPSNRISRFEFEVPLHWQHSPVLKARVRSTSSVTSLQDFQYELGSRGGSKGFSFGIYLEYWRRDCVNSVVPKYQNLKIELTRNSWATLSLQQYANLETRFRRILDENEFKANDIGVFNAICQIDMGHSMTIEQAIAIKVYTDFSAVQQEFKRHCRKLYHDETVQSVVKRNRENARWCRSLK